MRPLGATGVQVPALGFGVSGPHGAAMLPAAKTIRLIHQAAEGGAALFDTAPFYGEGEAERRLGAALKTLPRETVFLCTKAGSVRSGFRRLSKDFSPDGLRASLEGSLTRLGVDQVDAFLLHGPGPDLFNDEIFDVLDGLKREGKTRLTGVCGRGREIEAAIETGRFDLVMAPVNQACANEAGKRANLARAQGMGVLGIETMLPGTRGFRWPTQPADLWYLAREAVRRRRKPSGDSRQAAALHKSPPETATTPMDHLRWAIAENDCDCAIVTTTRTTHLRDDLEAARAAVSA